MAEQIETVVIGGGHAGLSMSYWLSAAGREHVVLERRRPFERWRGERWDSLSLIIPNYLIYLPGLPNPSTDAEGFLDRAQFMRYLEDYLVFSQPPLRTGVTVTSLEVGSDAWRFQVESDVGTIEAMNVVIATGPYQLPRIPSFASGIPSNVLQLASGQYRNPEQLPPGGVLVVGSGSSGLQIAEELYLAGRDVYVSVGRHRRQPRRYRGHDSMWWDDQLGLLDLPVEAIADVVTHPGAVALTGVRGGHDLDLARFAADGVTLLGRVEGEGGGKLWIRDDLAPNLANGELAFAELTQAIDDYIRNEGLDLPPSEYGPAGLSRFANLPEPILELDLAARGISTVIWCTGFRYDFGWIKAPVIDLTGVPIHRGGVTALPGLYFLGLKGMRSRRSSIVSGVGIDAEIIARQIIGE